MMQMGIFEERDKWTGYLVLSVALHLLLALAAVIGGYLSTPRGESWGGTTSGEAVQANLISAVPLPSRESQTNNILANDSKGLTQSVPQKAIEQPDAIPIPDKDTKRKQQKTAVTQAPEIHRPVPPPTDNAVPYGQGGPVNVSYGAFTVGNVQAGFNFDGDFGARFAWYVTVMKNKISSNWYANQLGPGAQGHKAYVSYDIARDGAVSNIKVVQSSNIPVLDTSAVNALQRSDPFERLPDQYSGSSLHVELTFVPPR